MSMETEIFAGKTLSDMFSDVYSNTESKRQQINQYVSSMAKLIRTPEDAVMIGPIIKEFLEVNVKNDEHIVRLVQIAQRMVSVSTKTTDSGELLSEEEKMALIENAKTEFKFIIEEQENLENDIRSLSK